MRRILFLLSVACGGIISARSPLGAQADPSAAAQRYFDALERQQWDSAAALVDPVSQRTFRDGALAKLVFMAEQGTQLRRRMRATGSSGALAAYAIDSLTPDRLAKYGAWRVPVYSGAPTIAA